MIITTRVCYKMKKGHSTLVMFPFAPPRNLLPTTFAFLLP